MLCIAACGGGSSSLSGSGGGSGTASNVQSVSIDSGPSAIANSTTPAINVLYTTVTICAPGSTTSCQTIDHIQVDTGSSGFRILANSGFSLTLPTATDSAGNVLAECVQFVDGSAWGPIRKADIKVAGEVASNVEIQVIGDGAYPTAPGACPTPIEDTVMAFGANGILGVGAFISDCGASCTVSSPNPIYYTCPTPTSCAGSTLAETSQVSNPVAAFATDNNGVIIQLPSVAASGAASVSGNLIFGIGTQSNNSLGSATILTVDAGSGSFTTLYKGAPLTASFIDSGSNGYFFPDTIMQCTDGTTFYCPTSPLSESGTMQGVNGTSVLVDFTVSSESALLSGSTVIAAAPDLAGSSATSGSGNSNGSNSFDWGLPFHFGRNVYTAIETKNAGGTMGPYFAF
jgi:Protein of unknown function (DUF3443)